jgi:hypothetical protein
MANLGIDTHDIMIHGGHTFVQGTNDSGHAFYTAGYTSKYKF